MCQEKNRNNYQNEGTPSLAIYFVVSILFWHKTPPCLLLKCFSLCFAWPQLDLPQRNPCGSYTAANLTVRQRLISHIPVCKNQTLKWDCQPSPRWHKCSVGMTGPWTVLLCSTTALVVLNGLLLQIYPGDATGKYFTTIIWCCRNYSWGLLSDLCLQHISPVQSCYSDLLHWHFCWAF